MTFCSRCSYDIGECTCDLIPGVTPDYSKYLENIGESLRRLVTLMESRSDRTLQGWKEIADYLGMSVSRAKRLGASGRRDRMPVYSFHGRVYAKPTALDRWRTDSSVAVGVG